MSQAKPFAVLMSGSLKCHDYSEYSMISDEFTFLGACFEIPQQDLSTCPTVAYLATHIYPEKL